MECGEAFQNGAGACAIFSASSIEVAGSWARAFLGFTALALVPTLLLPSRPARAERVEAARNLASPHSTGKPVGPLFPAASLTGRAKAVPATLSRWQSRGDPKEPAAHLSPQASVIAEKSDRVVAFLVADCVGVPTIYFHEPTRAPSPSHTAGPSRHGRAG